MALDQVDVDKDYPHEKQMGFFDHIDELRSRLVRVAYALLITTIAAFAFVEHLFELIVLSPFKDDFWGYRFFCKAGQLVMGSDALCWQPPSLTMQSMQIQGQFVSAFKISFVAAFVFSFPYIVNQLWKFIKPALSSAEIKRVQKSLCLNSYCAPFSRI